MAKDKNLILYMIVFILLLWVGINMLKYSESFAITGDDLPKVNEVVMNTGESFELFSNFTIANQTINFNIGNQPKVIISGANIFYMLDNSSAMYNYFPDSIEGTHTIKKYQMFIYNGTQINIQKFEKTYDLIVKTIIHNVTVANETFYIDKIVYSNQTNNTITYVNKTVEKQVMVEPTTDYLLQKYKIYLITIIAVGLVYYLTRKKK